MTLTALGLALGAWWAAAAPPGVDGIKSQVREWVTLRGEIGRVRGDWVEEEQLLVAEQRLLVRRADDLRGQLDESEREKADAVAAMGQAKADCMTADESLSGLLDAVRHAEAHMRSCRRRLPPLLQDQLTASFAALELSDADGEPRRVAERLQVVAALYAELQRLAKGVHTGKMLMTDAAGDTREMEVLFVGLTVGYAVSLDNTRAASGRPAARDWTWQWDAALAPAVRDALALARRDRAPALVTLPMRTAEADE